jgi:hypothetical protein
MRALFVAYCFGDASGHAQIGVYKRGLRVALELHERGHEVLFDCTGRTTYQDDQTALAEQRFRFVELHLDALHDDGLKRSWKRALRAMADCRPDLVVVCEAPQVGTLLEATLCAVELGIPVALLDNAYHPLAVPLFLWNHGGMMDGVVLNGPTCAHMRKPPPHVRQVPPYLTSDRAKAAELLEKLGLRSERLVCVPSYDPKVERLGFSLLERLQVPDADFLFMSRDPAGLEQRAAQMPEGLRQRVRTSGLLPEAVLFGLLELSKLAVVKCGFMQATECLSLRTPVICAYQGTHWFRSVPSACLPFIHIVEHDEADPATVAAAMRFLELPEQAMRSIHAGGFDATARAAEFLEALPAEQRADARAEAAEKFPEKHVRSALRSAFGGQTVTLRLLRAMRLRSLPGEEVYSLACRCTIDGAERFLRLWGRRYSSPWGVRRGRREAAHAGRRVLFASPRRRLLIEADAGQAELPPLVF